MVNGRSVTLVIPSLNEEEGVVATIQRAGSTYDEVIVVDGGSSDRTALNAERLGAGVIPQLVRGYGLAYKTGFLAAQGAAREMGLTVIALTGPAGALAPMADVSTAVPSSDTQHMQEAHLAIDYLICSLVERGLYGG